MAYARRGFDPRKVPTQKVILDRSQPLANRLISAIVPGIAGLNDLSGGGNSPAVTTGSLSYPSFATVPTSMGPAAHVQPHDACVWANPRISTVSGDFTVYWINYENSTESPVYSSQFTSRQPTDNSFDMGFSAVGAFHGDVGDGSNWINTNINGSSSLVFDNLPTHYAVTVQSGVSASVYCQGLVAGGAGLGGGTPLLWDSTHVLQMGSDTTYGLHGRVPFIGIWNRALTAGEIAQLYAEPFAMFRPVIRKQYYAQASAPSGVTGTVTATVRKPIASVSGAAAAPNETGTLQANTKKPVSNVTAKVGERATVTATVKRPLATVSGSAAVPNETGSISSTLKKPVAAVTGSSALPGTSATLVATTKKPVSNILGKINETGSIAATPKKLTANVAGSYIYPTATGTVQVTLKKPTATLSGKVGEQGTISAVTKRLLATVSGSSAAPDASGTVAATTKKLTAHASGNIGEAALISSQIKKPIATFLIAVQPVGSIAATAKKLVADIRISAPSTAAPPERTWTVKAENRIKLVEASDRIHVVNSEIRIHIV